MALSILDIDRLRKEKRVSYAELCKSLGITREEYKRRVSVAKRGGKSKVHPSLEKTAYNLFRLFETASNTSENVNEAPANDKADYSADDFDKTEHPDAGVGGNSQDDDELEEIKKKNRRAYGGENTYIGMNADQLVAAAKKLTPTDISQVKQIIDAAVRAGLGKLDFAPIKEALVKAVGIGKRDLDAEWKNAEERAAKERTETAEGAEDAKRRSAKERAAKAEELWPKVEKLAKDPNIIAHIIAFAHAVGVIGEEAGIVSFYLTATSRVAVRKSLALLRRGAAASGKNYLCDVLLKTLPPDDVVNITGASPKALHYYGDGPDDIEALKHKLLIIAEVASIESKGGEEHEVMKALRTLVQEGHIRYAFVDFETKQTTTMVKEGPTALVMTSARDNVEDEMLTRMMSADTDETESMTRAVVSGVYQRATGKTFSVELKYSREDLIDYQRWLSASGPFDFVVPYAEAIDIASEKLPAPLRARRDATNVINAIGASAILHNAQRARDQHGRVIATLDDYRITFNAFSAGMAATYAAKADPKVVILVEALERLLEKDAAPKRKEFEAWREKHPKAAASEIQAQEAAIPTTVQATYNQIKTELGISSQDAVRTRITAALTAEIIEIVQPNGFSGSRNPGRAANIYRIKMSSTELKEQAVGARALPTPDDVQKVIDMGLTPGADR